ncbi:MAG TPA: PIN domain-containing protein [Chloroflexota bacterium]|jgi:predicted nucleic acid-binding protein|nr:PIN domain-containing protein [Chloroflexota bacterium]
MARGDLIAECPDEAMARWAHRLIAKYSNLPMDLADATLVALAEARGLKRVFTLDRHFAVYRFADRDSFEVVPTLHR